MKTLVAAAAILLSVQAASASEYFAVKAVSTLDGIEFVTELSSQRGECPDGFQFARSSLGKSGSPVRLPHEVGCWILMPGNQIMTSWVNVSTGERSKSHYATNDFWTLEQPDFWWQFTPGFAELFQQ